MGYALVGSLGAVQVGASGASITCTLGQSATAGNLLILWVTSYSTITLPAAPAGWSVAKQVASAASSGTSSLFYKIAAGADANPVVAGITSTFLDGMSGEFSGGATSSPLDQSGSAANNSPASPKTTAAGSTDAALGELVVYSNCWVLGGAGTFDNTTTANNGLTPNDTSNNATSILRHYTFGYGITTGDSVADSITNTWTVSVSKQDCVIASFKLLPVAAGIFDGNAGGNISGNQGGNHAN